MAVTEWLQRTSPAFRLMIATSWLAPDSWRNNQEEAIRVALEAGLDWSEYLLLVDRHGTPAMSWAALGRVSDAAVPESVRQEMEKRTNACRVKAIRQCRELERLLKAFNRAGIPVMNLKGPMLSAELYGDVGLRQSNDLDLAVMHEHIDCTLALLRDLGWNLDPTLSLLTPRQWKKFHQMKDDLAFFRPEWGVEIEIHSRIHWDSVEQSNDRWARSTPTIWQGCTHQAMCQLDQVLYLCSHGGYHAWFRAKWLGDLARIHAQGLADWNLVLERSLSTGLEKPLLACLQILQIVHGLPLPKFEGDPWKNVHSLLIESPLHALKISNEPKAHGPIDLFRDLIYAIRYPRLVLPRKTWRQSLLELFYCRQDFRMIRLPDSLFWAYAPLRPVLFAWRKLARIRVSRGG